jgi:thiamine biosynthesis lipoprotein
MRGWEFPAMGTAVSVVAEAAAADQAADQVRRLFAEWEQRLSRFRPDSELSRLNARPGRPVVVSELLLDVLAAALRAARATRGLYDPTLLRALERLGYDRSFEKLGEAVPAAPEPVPAGGGWRRVELDPRARTVTLPPGVGVDLGGIAKGMAVDAAVERLRMLDVRAAMVSAGGDLRVHGLPTGGGCWPIAIEGPGGAATVALTRGSMATSRWCLRRPVAVRRDHGRTPRGAAARPGDRAVRHRRPGRQRHVARHTPQRRSPKRSALSLVG